MRKRFPLTQRRHADPLSWTIRHVSQTNQRQRNSWHTPNAQWIFCDAKAIANPWAEHASASVGLKTGNEMLLVKYREDCQGPLGSHCRSCPVGSEMRATAVLDGLFG
jgi:hypothetical protein